LKLASHDGDTTNVPTNHRFVQNEVHTWWMWLSQEFLTLHPQVNQPVDVPRILDKSNDCPGVFLYLQQPRNKDRLKVPYHRGGRLVTAESDVYWTGDVAVQVPWCLFARRPRQLHHCGDLVLACAVVTEQSVQIWDTNTRPACFDPDQFGIGPAHLSPR